MWTLGLISLEPPVHTRASLRSCPLPISPLCLSCLFPLEPKTQRSKKIIIINNAWSQVTPVHSGPLGARSIRPKFPTGPTGKSGARSIYSKIPTGPTGKSGPPQKVDPFFRHFSGWTEAIQWVLDRNFRKFWLNGSRPWSTSKGGPVFSKLFPVDRTDQLKFSEILVEWIATPVYRT